MKSKLNLIIYTIFSALVGAALTAIATHLLNQEQNKIRYLDYLISSESIFSLEQDIPKDKLKVIVNNNTNNPVKEVRQVTFTLYNLSDKDFDKMNLSLDLVTSKTNGQSFQIISSEIENSYKDNTIQISPKPTNIPQAKRFSYEINKLNRSDLRKKYESNTTHSQKDFVFAFYGILPVFKVTYILVGENLKNIDFNPKITETGVGIRESDISQETLEEYQITNQGNLLNIAVFKISRLLYPIGYIFGILLILIYLFAVIWFIKRSLRSTRIQTEKEFISNAKKNLLNQGSLLASLNSISNPTDLACKIVDLSSKIRNIESDKKFLKALTEKFSHSEEIANFQKLNEEETIEFLSKVYQEVFYKEPNLLELLNMGIAPKL